MDKNFSTIVQLGGGEKSNPPYPVSNSFPWILVKRRRWVVFLRRTDKGCVRSHEINCLFTLIKVFSFEIVISNLQTGEV